MLIADEPTGDLDPENTDRVLDIFDKVYREHKTTIVFATHAVDVVNRLSRRVIRMKNGRIESDTMGGYWAEDKQAGAK
jgi:cell division transport system ATP-binding protein